jgi:hypothetical protein
MSAAADVTASKQRSLWYFAVVPALMLCSRLS